MKLCDFSYKVIQSEKKVMLFVSVDPPAASASADFPFFGFTFECRLSGVEMIHRVQLDHWLQKKGAFVFQEKMRGEIKFRAAS